MDEQTKTLDKKVECIECKNEISLEDNHKVGDVVECPFCGIEYEVVEKDDSGEYTLKVIEEEK